MVVDAVHYDVVIILFFENVDDLDDIDDNGVNSVDDFDKVQEDDFGDFHHDIYDFINDTRLNVVDV